MPDVNGFYPPTQFSPLWLLLGVIIILAVIGWFVFVLIFTRKRPLRAATSQWNGLPQAVPNLRETYLTLIDEVQRATADGTLDKRDAHQRLSLLVREFAANARGVRAPYMTLEDLRATSLVPLAATVRELYPGAFSADSSESVAEAADRARRLVIEWR